jgi:hypothetical protein
MGSAQRYGELVADLSSHRARLSETQMVGVGGTPPANQTGLRGNELEVRFIAMPARLANRELAFFRFLQAKRRFENASKPTDFHR